MTVETALDTTYSVSATSGGSATDIEHVTAASKSEVRTSVTQAYLGKDFAKSYTLERQISFDLTIHADPSDAGLGILKTAYEGNSIVYITRSNDTLEYPCYVASYSESSSAGSVVEVSVQLLLADEPAVPSP